MGLFLKKNLFGVTGAVQVDFVVLLFLFACTDHLPSKPDVVNMRHVDTRSVKVRVRELDGKRKHSSLGSPGKSQNQAG